MLSDGNSGAASQTVERRRIVSALLEAVEGVGPRALTEADVRRRAGASVRGFQQHFDDLDACFDFACEAALDVLLGPMLAAWSVPRRRPERLAAALGALLGAFVARPRLAELCLIHSVARQPDRCTYRRLVDSFAELLVDVRRPSGSSASPPSMAGERMLARGAVGLIAARLGDGDGPLEDLSPPLLALLVPALELDGGS